MKDKNKRREKHLEFLAQVNLEFAPLLTVKEVIGNVGEQVTSYLNLSRCHFSVIDIKADRLEVVYEFPDGKDLPPEKAVHHLSDCITEGGIRHFSEGKIFKTNDAGDTAILHQDAKALRGYGLESRLDIPYVEGAEWKFLLTVGRDKPSEWRDEEIELLRDLASKIYIRVERARAEANLKRSEARFRTLTDAVPLMIWSNDEAGIANHFNQRWYDYSGLTKEESRGRGWEAIVHPEDLITSINLWQKALHGIQSFETAFRLRDRYGKYRWHVARNVPLKDEAGKVLGWFGSATDVENLKQTEEALSQSEAMLKFTLESATDYAIITMDTDRRVQKWSRGAELVFGYTEEEMIGQPADIIFTHEDRQNNVPAKEAALARDKGKAADDRWHLKKDGSKFFANGVMRPIIHGQITGYVKVLRDMTQQHLFTEELHRLVKERTAELERSNADLLQFAHVTSHDLKEPLRKIKTFSTLLAKQLGDSVSDESKAFLEKINNSVSRLTRMIEAILNYSRIDRSTLMDDRVDLNLVFDGIENDLELNIAEKQAVISRTDFPEVIGNAILLHQLFYNLLANSLKFAAPGKPLRVEVTYKYISLSGSRFIEIIFKDNGLGFESQYDETIFDAFFRLNSKDDFEGTGLGLALAKKIVSRHHGFIYAKGEPGQGATFTIQIPQ